MRTQTRERASEWATKSKMLAVGLLLMAAMMMASTMAAGPARASTIFTVTSTGDFHDTIIGDGFCGFGGSCSLRAAIEEANFTSGADTINFAIPGTGVKTINVGSTGLGDLPTITEQVTINGYTSMLRSAGVPSMIRSRLSLAASAR